MSERKTLLGSILERLFTAGAPKGSPAGVSKGPPIPSTGALKAKADALETEWAALAEQADEELKNGDASLALEQYRKAFEVCRTAETLRTQSGSSRQVTKLCGLTLGAAKALIKLGRTREALVEIFLLSDIAVSSTLEMSRFLYEEKTLSKREYDSDIREAYKDEPIPGGWSIDTIRDIKKELRLSAEELRAEYDNMVSAYHEQLSLETDIERLWKGFTRYIRSR